MQKRKIITYFVIVQIMMFYSSFKNQLFAQNDNITVTGIVRSDTSVLEGVTIYLKGKDAPIYITKPDGSFKILVPSNGTLIFNFVGYQKLEQPILGNPTINVKLEPDAQALDEVVTVGYGQQKKQGMVSSVTTVKPAELKGPTSNLTTMLAGRISGMIAYQRSGEPGSDNASFFIRGLGSFGSGKVDPLILIDQVESSSTDLARLQADDIASFSVLKDATAAAVYGARGANGVLIITTKSGEIGKTSFSGRFENSVSTNTRNFQLADNITYMELANEAALTRDPLATLPYSQLKIDRTKVRDNPLLYPNNNWIKQLISDNTQNQRFNFSITGGAPKARFYLAGTYNVDHGLLKDNKLNNFDNNIKLQNYSIRSNIDLKLTNTMSLAVRVYAQFDDYRGPIGTRNSDGTMGNGGSAIFNQAIWSNPVMFPAIYPQSYLPYIQHPLFGNAIIPNTTSTLFINPYANMVSSYAEYKKSNIQAQADLKQSLDFLIDGLNFNAMTYVKRYSYFDVSRSYNPFYYSAITNDNRTISDLLVLNDGGAGSVGTTGTEYLNYSEGYKMVTSTFYAQASLNYAHSFGRKSDVSGMVIGIVQNNQTGNAGSLQLSLPQKNAGVSGRFTYSYDRKYNAEFDFGYNGTERFASNSRFGFFPSFGLSWVVSNEDFFKPLLSVVSNLKFRGTLGLVGNDQIGSSLDRFFYLSEVNMNNSGYSSTFGLDYGYTKDGISISRYANPNITWERSRQLNIGMDMTLFKDLNITVDAYKNIRKNILLERSYIPSTMGLQADVYANVGKAESKGVDIMMNYNHTINKDWWLQGRFNFTYAASKVLVYDEPDYSNGLQNLTHVGNSISQTYGYLAERLFIDDAEVSNSPTQTFGQYMAGDIKYHDIDKDGSITSNDLIPIGWPTTPEITYGFGFSLGYKHFDFSSFFQGSARSSFFINPENITPFYVNGRSQNGLLTSIATDHWSEDNRNVYAFWPRLSSTKVDNNDVVSSWWMRDGTFLRWKNAEVGYSFSPDLLKKLKFKTIRFYMNATNLAVWSKFKLWDPEMGGSGLGYPVQRVYNFGCNFNF